MFLIGNLHRLTHTQYPYLILLLLLPSVSRRTSSIT